jgi:hypothetical protein
MLDAQFARLAGYKFEMPVVDDNSPAPPTESSQPFTRTQNYTDTVVIMLKKLDFIPLL